MEYHVLGWTGSPLEVWLSISNVSTQSLVDLLKCRLSHHHEIHPSTSYAYQPNPMTDHPQKQPLQIMHDHLDLRMDLSSHLCTWWPTLILMHLSLVKKLHTHHFSKPIWSLFHPISTLPTYTFDTDSGSTKVPPVYYYWVMPYISSDILHVTLQFFLQKTEVSVSYHTFLLTSRLTFVAQLYLCLELNITHR